MAAWIAFDLGGWGASSVDLSVVVVDGADVPAGLVGPLVAGSVASTDAADTLAAATAPLVAASSGKTDGADGFAAGVGPVVGASSGSTDGADVAAVQAAPVVAASSSRTDGADTLAATVSPRVDAHSTLTDGADVLASAVSPPVLSVSSASIDGADVVAGAIATVIDLGSTNTDGADLLTASAGPVVADVVLVPYRIPRMSDITTNWDAPNLRGDWTQAGASLQSGADVVTAVLISLFTDRIANADDVIPDGTSDPRGWWGDDPNYPIGSRLWLLGREKQLDVILQRAHDYCVEALQWMIDDGIVTKFDISAEWLRASVLGIEITVYRREAAPVTLSLNATREAAGFSFSVLSPPAPSQLLPSAASPAPTPAPSPAPAPAPVPVSGVPIIAIADEATDVLEVGDHIVHSNVWNAAGLTRGTYAGLAGTTYEQQIGVAYPPGGFQDPIGLRIKWAYPTGTTEVKSYPSIITGNFPGWYQPNTPRIAGTWALRKQDGTYSTATPSGKTPNTIFPIALPIAGNLQAQSSWVHNTPPTGRGHLSYDIWVQSSSTQGTGFTVPPIHTEIMIPMTYWGGYGAYVAGGGGRNPDWYWGDDTIDGYLWHIFQTATTTNQAGGTKSNWFNGSWNFMVFEPDSPTALPANYHPNLKLFLNYAKTQGWFDVATPANPNPGTHVVSVELGVECVSGTGDLTFYNYKISNA